MIKKLFAFWSFVVLLSSYTKDEKAENLSLQAETKMDLAYGNDALQKMDVYLPAGRSADSTRVIVMIHGGAWAEGDKTVLKA